jgi:hypothetical protein
MPNGTSTAVTEATRLAEIGFPEFTAKLAKDVFDALLAATLRQMEAYSELVAATAKTLQDYVAENFNFFRTIPTRSIRAPRFAFHSRSACMSG